MPDERRVLNDGSPWSLVLTISPLVGNFFIRVNFKCKPADVKDERRLPLKKTLTKICTTKWLYYDRKARRFSSYCRPYQKNDYSKVVSKTRWPVSLPYTWSITWWRLGCWYLCGSIATRKTGLYHPTFKWKWRCYRRISRRKVNRMAGRDPDYCDVWIHR